jgi:HEAT repeat protein
MEKRKGKGKKKKKKKRNRAVEPTMSMPIEEIIAELGDDDKSILSSKLSELSNLDSTALELFIDSWATIETERRRQIVVRLAEIAEDNVILSFDGIFKYCLKDGDDEVRSTAIEGLWENEESSLIDPLINMLEEDSSEKVQAVAAIALGKFVNLGEDKKLHPNHMDKVHRALLGAFGDKSRPLEIRRRALESIAPASLPEVKTAIREAHESQNPRLVISAVYAMGKSYDLSWLPLLIKELDSPDAEVRYEAAGACRELEEETAVPHLIRLVDDFDADVQVAALQALAEIANTQAQECLKRCLESEDEVVRQTAEEILNELQEREDPLSFQM